MVKSDTSLADRRTVLKGIGGLAATGALAGCTGGGDGGDGGDGGSGGSGGDGGSGGSGGDGGSSETSSSSVSYNSLMGIVETELSQIPSLAALTSMLPEATDDQHTGEFRTFRDSSLPMQAMVGGEVDIYALSFGNVVQAHLSGNDIVTLGPKVTGTDYQFVIRTDIEAGSLADLVNGDYTIGVAGLGGLSHIQVAGVLAQEDLTTDVEEAGIQNIGGSGTRTSAIASGKIDGTAVHIDQVQRLQDEGAKIEVLFDFREYYPNFVSQAITVTREFLESEEGQAHLSEYMQVMLEANELATTDFDWLHEQTQQVMENPLGEEEARESWEFNAETINAWQFESEGFANSDFETYAQALVAGGVLEQSQYDQIQFDEILVHDMWDEAASNRDISRWE